MDKIEILKTRDNNDCICLDRENKLIPLGSKYNFKNDVDTLISKIENINIGTTIIINGLYNGDYIEELEKYLSSSNEVFIIEFNKDVYIKYNKNNYDNINVIFYEKDSELINAFYKRIEENVKNILFIDFGNYNKIYRDKINEITLNINDLFINSKINDSTMEVFKKTWFECFVNNLPNILEGDYLENYKDYYKDYPAIIVSAGPSLEKNIQLLKHIENKVVIICNGRTLKVLKKYNIKPTFVCVIDPGQGSYTVIKDDLDTTIPMIFNELTNSKVVKEYKGKKISYTNANVFQISQEIFQIENVVSLYQGGSVAHSSIDSARYLGCNPIVMIGQDLAYTNEKCHSDSAAHDVNNNIGQFDMRVEDINGNLVGTSFMLNFFRLNLESYIKNHDEIRYINATEGGANINGTKTKKLLDIVQLYKNGKDIPEIRIKKYFTDENKTSAKEKISQYKMKFKNIKRKSEEILKYNERFLEFFNRNNFVDNKINGEIEKREKVIMKEIEALDFIRVLLFPLIEKILNDPIYIEKKNSNDIEKVTLVYEKTNEIYNEIIKSIDIAIKVIIDSLGEDFEKLI